MSRRAATLTIAVLAGWGAVAAGQSPTPVAYRPSSAGCPTGSPSVTLGPPTVTLGPPVAARVPVVRGQNADDGVHYSQWVAATTEPAGDGVPGIVPLQVPTSYVSTSSSAPYAPDPPQPPAYEPEPPSPGRAAVDKPSKHERKSYFGEMFEGWGGGGPEGKCFESDHCFDYFASPVSNPFFAEDPRALTEIRPIFLFQTLSSHNGVYRGGNAEFYGTQARVAITDQWSFVMNKLGGVSVNPGSSSLLPSETAFAEIWLGPKWTFLRNTETGTVAAAGVTFQIPTSSSRVVAQDTGNLSVAPYITAAQNFGCTSFGSFNAMGTLGYSFGDHERSDYLFSSLHLDYDVGGRHFLYPLVELNWFYYTRDGHERPFGFEGQDLFNFGSNNVSGKGDLSIAIGVRYKFSECIQTGVALEFPLTHTKDFQSFRLGLDVIFRY
jgi:hypothetical protein